MKCKACSAALLIGLLLMLVVSVNAAAGVFNHTMDWKEEVLLHDGSKVIAERHYTLGGYPEIASQERAALDVTVKFDLPGTNKKIIWKTDYDNSNADQNSLNLIRLDVVNGVPYIATYPAGCIAYNKWGRPNPPQILFKYENDQWQRITLAELPPELIGTHANVIVGKPAAKLLKPFYNFEGVNDSNHDISTPEYKIILRDRLPAKYIENMCMEMVLYKGSWVMPDDPIARRLIDARQKQN
jgi:hypothetical protein